MFDKNIPIPPSLKIGRPPGFWALAEVGDSRFYPKIRTAMSRVSEAKKKHPDKRFEWRPWEQDGIQGARVWRVK